MAIGQVTKQQRKAERQQLGQLQDLVVEPGTLQRYHEHFNRFCDWASANEFSLTSSWDFDSTRSQYIEGLWSDGGSKSEGSYIPSGSGAIHGPEFET